VSGALSVFIDLFTSESSCNCSIFNCLLYQQELAAGPTAREGHCSCVSGTHLYVFGGVSIGDDEIQENDDLWKYDIGKETHPNTSGVKSAIYSGTVFTIQS